MNDLERHLLQTGFTSLTWTAFCVWLAGKRIDTEHEIENAAVELTFTDGSVAVFISNYQEPTDGYSEITPGDPGRVLAPSVFVCEAPSKDPA